MSRLLTLFELGLGKNDTSTGEHDTVESEKHVGTGTAVQACNMSRPKAVP